MRAVAAVLRRALIDEPSPDELPPLPRRYAIYGRIVSLIVLNFACFLVVDLVIGGDAWSGRREGERYSWWHATSIMVTWPIGLFIAWRMQRMKRAAEAKRQEARG